MAAKTLALIALAGLAAFAALTAKRASDRTAAAEAAYPPIGQLIMVGDRQVHAFVTGAGPDLVLIHGAGGNLRDYTMDFVGRVSDQYRVIVFDRPGLGYTDRTDPRYDRAFSGSAESPAEQAALLQAAAAQLGAEQPIVVGHSFGGAVALAWALNHPDALAGVVDVAGAAMPWPGTLGWTYRVNGSAIGGALLPPLIAAWLPEDQIGPLTDGVFDPNPAPEDYAGRLGVPLSLRTATLRANARQVNTLYPHVVEMEPRYPDIDVPVEIVHGDADITVPIDIHSGPLSELIPGANLTILPGIGHMPQHSAPEDVVAAIDRVAVRAGLR